VIPPEPQIVGALARRCSPATGKDKTNGSRLHSWKYPLSAILLMEKQAG
jgi:hypothetical protein